MYVPLCRLGVVFIGDVRAQCLRAGWRSGELVGVCIVSHQRIRGARDFKDGDGALGALVAPRAAHHRARVGLAATLIIVRDDGNGAAAVGSREVPGAKGIVG